MKKRFILFIVLSFYCAFLPAQEIRDTLKAAIKIDSHTVMTGLGRLETGLEGMRAILTPLGEGDPIHWAQAMPGVATGADGSSAFYVRGGNMGNNLFSLDGVPVYGYSHLLGLTTIIPEDAVDKVNLSRGGFNGGDNNFTAAHLSILTKDPSKAWRTHLSLNNFMASASAEGSMSDNLSTLLSVRISPLALEYRAASGLLPGGLGDLKKYTAGVGDLYGKVLLKGEHYSLQASFLGSLDKYGFDTSDASHEEMGWNNLVGSFKYSRGTDENRLNIILSANRYESFQQQAKSYRGTEDYLSLKSLMKEFTLSTDLSHKFADRVIIKEGMKMRLAQFSPGQVASVTNMANTLVATLWGELCYCLPDLLVFQAAVRGNYFRNFTKGNGRVDPELSLLSEWILSNHFTLRGTFDRMSQYYHTLEGLPIGWSLDMLVPSGQIINPEGVWQGNLGLSIDAKSHSVSLDGFCKFQENLLYYKYAQNLFDGALAAWEDHVDTGNGVSFGAELLCEYTAPEVYGRLSYTLSKTTRKGFQNINEGEVFHARFDRRHVLNALVQWKEFTAALVLQSGHWENGASQTYTMHIPGASWKVDYYSGVNNYHMPTVIRLDLGYRFSFETRCATHDIQVGICNVTNHFNPFMLYFDTGTETWKEIALLPIMPNMSWKISFGV